MRTAKLIGVLSSFIIITAANMNLYRKVVEVEKDNEKEVKLNEHKLVQEFEKIKYNILIYVRIK